MGILSLILGPVVGAVNGFFTRRHELKMAQHAAQVKWASTMADASKTSWKDEYVLILWTSPILLAIFGFSEPLERFLALLIQLPEWYTALIVTLSLATFGISAKGKWETLKSKVEFVRTGTSTSNGGDSYMLPDPVVEDE